MEARRLGVLTKVDLRKIWPHEALDFTRWLSNEENIQLLCDELDIELENIKVEEAAGRFNVDIVAEEVVTKRRVIIENQLEITDHKHLGQLLTYAAAHDAGIIVWNVKNYTEEHKQAIDWFNRNMPEGISFFLVQVELWQIADSPPAPKFNVVSQPNNWAKTVKRTGNVDKDLPSELKLLQQKFWSDFREYVNNFIPKTSLNLGRTPRPQHWYDISIGTTKALIALTFNSRQKQLGCELYIRSDGAFYQMLKNDKEKIEAEVGGPLNWMDLPDSTAFRIITYQNFNPTSESGWQSNFEWLKSKAEIFQKTFKRYLVPSYGS
ncbi:DUF4268 domain-containing protein [Fibrisoma montanum]|uniref:DUF4268 domain-containing protein n=1 Tax=Fibrisoma montanum TaxID=2305895 RepID=A0A418LXY4_9BACT|nr:DUF4268 domain-containing protein [Fibrisoma montanum]RIV18151.1 DUF4268 domain-containing protein [Fibrisoma montanum]